MSDFLRKISFRSILLLSFLSWGPANASAQTPSLDPIIRQGNKPIRIAIESTSGYYQGLAERAFRLHGAFEVSTASAADWILSLNVDELRAEFAARGVDSATTRSQGSAVGATPDEAFRKALDTVVRDFTGVSGFFNGMIAFVAEPTGKSEIYTSDILFESVLAVTNLKNNVVSPRWSPDGKRLIYTTYALTGYPDIVVQDLDRKSLVPVANYRGVNLGGRFRPDGRSIAFVASSSGSPEVYIARPDGSGARRQTWTKGLAATPTWSPDSQRIVFTSDDWGGPQLILLDPARKKTTRIKTGMGGYNAEPAWNPVSADLIAFTTLSGSEYQLAVYSFAEGRSEQLTQEPGSCVEPTWMSDGRHLAFTYRYRGSKQLKILDTQTRKIAN